MNALRSLIGTEGRAAGIVLCILASLAVYTWAFDFSRYQPRMMRELIAEHPSRSGLIITRDIPIRLRVVYTGEFRELADDSRRLIAAWADSFNMPAVPGAFRRELKVVEAGLAYWVPVQEVLVPAMQREFRPGKEIELFNIYIGQVDSRHIFLVNEFGHESPH